MKLEELFHEMRCLRQHETFLDYASATLFNLVL